MKAFPILILSMVIVTCKALCQPLFDDTRITDLHLRFYQANWQSILENNANNQVDIDIPAVLIVDGKEYDSVGVRYKGFSSLVFVNSDKKPFNVSIDAFIEGQDIDGFNTINLNNVFGDPSYVREKLSYDIAQRYLPTVQSSFVRLTINNQYWGVYFAVQQPNKRFLRDIFGQNADGNLYKGDPNGDLRWMGNNANVYRQSYEKKTNEIENDWSDLIDLIDVLNNTPDSQFAQEIDTRLNVDRILWYIAFNNVILNLDSYFDFPHNYYIYHDDEDDRFHIIPWDMNLSFGVFTGGRDRNALARLSIYSGEGRQSRPLGRLFDVPEFRARYLAHFRTIFEEFYTQEYLETRGGFYQDLIRAAVESSPNRLYPLAHFTLNLFNDVESGGFGRTPGIIQLANERRQFLEAQPDLQLARPEIADPIILPSEPSAGQDVEVSVMIQGAVEAQLWWAHPGRRFTRIAMTGSGNMWTARIPSPSGGVVRYYIEALSPSSAVRFHPERAETEFFTYRVQYRKGVSPIVINELVAANSTVNADPQNEFDDWAELFNTSDEPVDLGGMYLSDAFGKPRKWRFPDGTILGGGEYLLVWLDNDPDDVPGLHTNFKLDKDGETLYLIDSEENANDLLDSARYERLEEDQAWGRSPNGAGEFGVLITATPGAQNGVHTHISSESVNYSANITNSPNPFQTNTVIRLTAPTTASIPPNGAKVQVYDVFGSVVTELSTIGVRPGEFTAEFDGTQFPPGAYMYRCILPSGTLAGRMLLVR